jgi:hypothetical protein
MGLAYMVFRRAKDGGSATRQILEELCEDVRATVVQSLG